MKRVVAGWIVFFGGALFVRLAVAVTPIVQLETSDGAITLELYPGQAPVTVANFLGYVQEGFYDGTLFHRVIDGFMIQGGGFDGNFTPRPTREPIQNEANNGLKNERGTIAMARTSDPHSATSQFFINLVDNPFLDFTGETADGWGYAVFGKVIDGMAVVDRIARVETTTFQSFQNVPADQVVIHQARLISQDSEPSYDPVSRQVDLPIVQVGETLYSAAMVSEGGGVFRIARLDPLSVVFDFPRAVYGLETERLKVQRVRAGEGYYDAELEYLGDLRLKLLEVVASE